MSRALLDDLQATVANGTALVVMGAGVAIRTTSGAPTASWKGLLLAGVDRVEELRPADLPPGWETLAREWIQCGEPQRLLAVAEQVTKWLDGPYGGEFRRWLRDALGDL